jgi:hypothetical protein
MPAPCRAVSIASYQAEQRRINAIEEQPINALPDLAQIRAI